VVLPKDLDFRDVKLVVDFIYTSSASQLSRENAPNVLKIADLFLIQQLKMLCIDFITKNMITMRSISGARIRGSCGLWELKVLPY
jgi:hypothetical protein